MGFYYPTSMHKPSHVLPPQWKKRFSTLVTLVKNREYRISMTIPAVTGLMTRSHCSTPNSSMTGLSMLRGLCEMERHLPSSNSTTYAYGIADMHVQDAAPTHGFPRTPSPRPDSLSTDPVRKRWTSTEPTDTDITLKRR